MKFDETVSDEEQLFVLDQADAGSSALAWTLLCEDNRQRNAFTLSPRLRRPDEAKIKEVRGT